MKILYTVINGEVTGGNIICFKMIEEALRRNYEVIVNSPTNGKFTDILKERNIKVYNIDTRHSFRLDNAVKLSRIIRKEKIDLLHSHVPLTGTILCRLGGWMGGVSVINHVHSQYFSQYFLNPNIFIKIFQFLLNWVSSRFFCDKVITVCRAIKDELIRFGTPASRISVVHNGIDLNDCEPKDGLRKIREEFGLQQNQRIIGEVARITDAKGQHILIEALGEVRKVVFDVTAMFVGENLEETAAYTKQLEHLVNRLGLTKQVIFTGYRKDIIDLINAFEIFVLPSSGEGLSVVILEAMAEKKPVIATSVGGNPEIIINGETGILIPPKDSHKLAEAIIYLLKNPAISKAMGEKGRQRVKEYFSSSEMLNKVFSIYNELLAGRQ